MGCQVGITMNPVRRKEQWAEKRPSLRNWQVLSRHRSRSAAQKREDWEAARRGCNAHHGGRGPENAIWYVYYFEY